MSDLFALRCIESDMLFRNDEYIAPAKAKAMQRLMVDLCRRVWTYAGECDAHLPPDDDAAAWLWHASLYGSHPHTQL